MCITDRHDMTVAVKVALNLNTTNQPTFLRVVKSRYCEVKVKWSLKWNSNKKYENYGGDQSPYSLTIL